MKVIIEAEEDTKNSCDAVLDEIRDKMEEDYPEITSYEVRI